jgi:hypothetical protein
LAGRIQALLSIGLDKSYPFFQLAEKISDIFFLLAWTIIPISLDKFQSFVPIGLDICRSLLPIGLDKFRSFFLLALTNLYSLLVGDFHTVPLTSACSTCQREKV